MEKNIFHILRKKFPEREYALMQEVSDAAGFNRSNSADFIAVGLWPSRGLAINGIEVKSFRSDWLRELKKPDKAENIFKYCDYFWLLTSDETIAKLEEIPPTWGWMSIKGEKIIIKKEAPALSPLPVSKNFLAAMLKRAQDKTNWVHADSIKDKISEAKEYARSENKRQIDRLEKELAEITNAVKEFKEASGIDLKYYPRYNTSPKKMGEALKLLENGGAEHMKKKLLDLEKTAKTVYDAISKAIESLHEAVPEEKNKGAATPRELINEFCLEVQLKMLDLIKDHGKHATFCNDINEIKSNFLEKKENPDKITL
jgi:hypothetical protein